MWSLTNDQPEEWARRVEEHSQIYPLTQWGKKCWFMCLIKYEHQEVNHAEWIVHRFFTTANGIYLHSRTNKFCDNVYMWRLVTTRVTFWPTKWLTLTSGNQNLRPSPKVKFSFHLQEIWIQDCAKTVCKRVCICVSNHVKFPWQKNWLYLQSWWVGISGCVALELREEVSAHKLFCKWLAAVPIVFKANILQKTQSRDLAFLYLFGASRNNYTKCSGDEKSSFQFEIGCNELHNQSVQKLLCLFLQINCVLHNSWSGVSA